MWEKPVLIPIRQWATRLCHIYNPDSSRGKETDAKEL